MIRVLALTLLCLIGLSYLLWWGDWLKPTQCDQCKAIYLRNKSLQAKAIYITWTNGGEAADLFIDRQLEIWHSSHSPPNMNLQKSDPQILIVLKNGTAFYIPPKYKRYEGENNG